MPHPNPLLAPADTLIDYAAVLPEHIEPALRELIHATRQAVEDAAASTEPVSWENLIEAIETPSERLQRAWSVAGHLNSVVNTPELRAAFNACLPLMSEFSTWVGLHTGLYVRYQALAHSPLYATLTPTRRRIIDLALRDFRLSGVELQGVAREDYARNADEQAQVTQKFSENVMDATDEWSLIITDRAQLSGVPDDVIEAARAAALAEDTEGYKLVLQMPCYLPVMQHAHDRTVRSALYRAYATRASEQGDVRYDNSSSIESLLALRAAEAKLLGYDDFAALRLETRMADSAIQVLSFLRTLATRARPSAEQDLAKLQAFAADSLGLATLEPWDVAYASERLREQRYAYSDDEVRQYFTEPRVLEGLFNVIHRLFGVHLVEHDIPVWHSDAHAYSVQNVEGVELGTLYLDLYARSGKQGGAWVNSERSRRLQNSSLHTPIIWLTCNFAPPQGGRDALLSHDDIITLFHESGHAMHALLSRVDEPAAAAFAAVEWDAIELPSQFMENFCWEWDVLRSLSSHVDTGESIPRVLYDKLLAARNFQSGLQMLRQVEFSLFDMLIHTHAEGLSIANVLKTLDTVRDEVAVIIPPSWHRFPHAFSHLFAGGYGAGYYSYKWAEVLSADAFAAFEETAHPANDGSRDVFDTVTCRRYLDEIIAVGGSRPAAQSFEAFRGRAPSMDALLRHSGLNHDAN